MCVAVSNAINRTRRRIPAAQTVNVGTDCQTEQEEHLKCAQSWRGKVGSLGTAKREGSLW